MKIPIALATLIIAGIVYATTLGAKVEYHEKTLDKIVEHYEKIERRLSRIEGALNVEEN